MISSALNQSNYPAPVLPGIEKKLSAEKITALLLVCGCLNGLIAEIGRSLQEQGLNNATGLFGVGFYFPAIIGIAFSKIWADNSEHDKALSPLVIVSACLFCAMVLVPSSLVSWLVVGLFATMVFVKYSNDIKIGAGLFAVLALCAIWANFGFKAFVTPLTNLDTILIQHILQFLGYIVDRKENILTQVSGFSVIILSDCSTWKGLPLEILSFFAVCIFGGSSVKSKRIWLATIIMIPVMIILNLARLSLISLSPELHETVHGDVGRSIFDVIRVTAIFMTALFIVQ